MEEPTWTVVLAVKRLEVAKSRLRGALPRVPHDALCLALAQDTAAAALACPPVARVLVVTEDPRVAQAMTRLGAQAASGPPGLNPAFAHGAGIAGTEWVAALPADLPALRPADLAAALHIAGHRPGVRHFVADAVGTGTVLLAASPGVPLDPRFGPDSAALHAASGALPLAGDLVSLRRDVDTPADLRRAATLGFGPHTGALLATASASTT